MASSRVRKQPVQMFKKALRSLKIRPGEVVSWRQYDDRVVLVTRAGRKLTYRGEV